VPHQLGYQVRWDPALAQADREGPPQIVGAGIFHPSAGSGVPLIDNDTRCLADPADHSADPLLLGGDRLLTVLLNYSSQPRSISDNQTRQADKLSALWGSPPSTYHRMLIRCFGACSCSQTPGLVRRRKSRTTTVAKLFRC
jgi:hypothetical protein